MLTQLIDCFGWANVVFTVLGVCVCVCVTGSQSQISPTNFKITFDEIKRMKNQTLIFLINYKNYK